MPRVFLAPVGRETADARFYPLIPVDVERVRQHTERNGLDYLGPLT